MMLVDFVNVLLAISIIFSQIGILALVIYALFFRKEYPGVANFFGKHGMLLAFLVVLASTAGSLFYSQYAGFTPCDLCWFQRIFIYPQVILLGMALIKKDWRIIDYSLALAVIGTIISLNQNYLYYNNNGLTAACLLGGVAVSCVKRYVFEFGYVTIPMMALTSFALTITFLVFSYVARQRAGSE